MLIFVTLQFCVNWHMDTCFPMQNTQNTAPYYSTVTNYSAKNTAGVYSGGVYKEERNESYQFIARKSAGSMLTS